MKQPIIMDVDTGIDDSLALLYLLASPEADILAITCTSGNVPARQVAINNLAWLELCGAPEIEVSLGSEVPILAPLMTTEETHGPQGIGYAELPEPTRTISSRHATEVWVELARSRPGEIVGLVTGPLTNLALALRIEPELPRLLFGHLATGLAQEGVREQAAAHPDLAVDPPDGQVDPGAVQGETPCQHVLVDAVDEGAVEVEQEPLGPIHAAMLRARGCAARRRWFPRGWLVATLRP